MKTILKFLTVVVGLIFMVANTTFAGTNQSPGTVKDICFAKDAVQLVLTSGNITTDLSTAGEVILSPQNSSNETAVMLSAAVMNHTWNLTAETPALVQWRSNYSFSFNNMDDAKMTSTSGQPQNAVWPGDITFSMNSASAMTKMMQTEASAMQAISSQNQNSQV